MLIEDLQSQCERGQEELSRTNYLEAERLLAEAERQAWTTRDFDTLSRLYMPLQEARRQRRQRCGEGEACLDLWAQSPSDQLQGRHIVQNYPAGQLLVAGWASIEPALQVRRLAQEHGLYLETFLGAVYPTSAGPAIVVVARELDRLPPATGGTIEELRRNLPEHSLLFGPDQLPRGVRAGNAQTYAEVMDLWERLHSPFLKAAQAQTDPLRKIEGYRRTIEVDYACELAHQELSETARTLAHAR